MKEIFDENINLIKDFDNEYIVMIIINNYICVKIINKSNYERKDSCDIHHNDIITTLVNCDSYRYSGSTVIILTESWYGQLNV